MQQLLPGHSHQVREAKAKTTSPANAVMELQPNIEAQRRGRLLLAAVGQDCVMQVEFNSLSNKYVVGTPTRAAPALGLRSVRVQSAREGGHKDINST